MFANGYQKAIKFTKPVIISTVRFDGTVESGCGSFVLVNKEGWIITAAHIFEPYFMAERDKSEIEKYQKEVDRINKDSGLDSKRKRKKIGKLCPNPKWIKIVSYWWGGDNVKIGEVINNGNDLAIAKIENSDEVLGEIDENIFPIFKSPDDLDSQVGTSLCKLGFPLNNINANFNGTTFTFQQGILPIPFFPLEGIYTRNVKILDENTGNSFDFIETSSPGLRGQSGGPIFDTNGVIWGIQSHTLHNPLGFDAVDRNGRVVEQFLNVGLGIHPAMISKSLMKEKIKFKVSEN